MADVKMWGKEQGHRRHPEMHMGGVEGYRGWDIGVVSCGGWG